MTLGIRLIVLGLHMRLRFVGEFGRRLFALDL